MRLAIPLLLASLAIAQQGDRFVEAMRAGGDALAKGKFDDAVSHFAKARQMRPKAWEGHAWQAIAHIEQARREFKDERRRKALTREAEAMTTALVKQAGLLFQHPLRQYLLGMCASVRGESERAMLLFHKAHTSPARYFKGFESIRLRESVDASFGSAATAFAAGLIAKGKFKEAEPLLLRAAGALPKGDPVWRTLERSLAVVDEAMGRHDSAIKRLRKCIELHKARPDLQLEFLATIAQIHFKTERFEEGAKVLKEAPEDATHPGILAARCTARLHSALRADPKDAQVDKALEFYRTAMERIPTDQVALVVEDYARLVLHKVGPGEVAAQHELVEDTSRRLMLQIARQPDCPAPYFLLYRIFKLQGDEDNAAKYKKMHAEKKKAYDEAGKKDERSRPRCN